MTLKFTKMHGAGNDFIVIDAINQSVNLTSELCQQLADRRFGIGADQILLVEKSHTKGVDFRYRIFNSDGSEVEQCGNGARAFVKFVVDKGLTDQRQIKVETMAGTIAPKLEEDGRITVDMGAPIFSPDLIPFDAQGLQSTQQHAAAVWPLQIGATSIAICVVSMGNPHAVQIVSDVDTADVAQTGPLIENHVRFPKRVNAGFMQIIDRHHIQLRVYERGAGETLSCGTGACAAAVSGIQMGLLDSPVKVSTKGGTLSIAWGGDQQSVLMTGPAMNVFEGSIDI
jgi:diaminopimelate epimerase